jgi:hypothetical protein
MTPNADTGGHPRFTFLDPIRDRLCALVVPPDGRVYGEPKIGIAHPDCDSLADLSVELDAFYCPACGWNGRVSGAWCVDMIEGTASPNGSSGAES